MRQKRIKSYRKVMQLYSSTFGFREPYQLLVDAEFCKSCVHQKLDFQARIEDVLQGGVKPMITQCCMEALYALGPEGQGAVDLAKGFERRKCNHFKTRPQDECMTAMAGTDNRNRYVIATQSLPLRKTLRGIPGLPLVYINRSVVLLETPSDQTMNKKKSLESHKLHAPASELAMLSKTDTSSNSTALIDAPYASTSSAPPPTSTEGATPTPTTIEEAPKKKKKKGPKGPNPLSVKKKKPDPNSNTSKKRARVESGEEVRAEKKRKREDEEKGKVRTGAIRNGEEGEAKRRKRKRGRKGENAPGGKESMVAQE